MKILAIETVTRTGSLAVLEDQNILAETTIDTSLNHAGKLVTVLDRMLSSVKVSVPELYAVAVDTGPGSFTGIRVGIATAKGLAEPDDREIIGVCSLEVLCRTFVEEFKFDEKTHLVPVIDAKRGGIYAAVFRFDGNKPVIEKEPFLTNTENLIEKIPKNSRIFGPDEIDGLRKDTVCPKAGIAAKIAERLLKDKENYIKKPVVPMYLYDVEYRK